MTRITGNATKLSTTGYMYHITCVSTSNKGRTSSHSPYRELGSVSLTSVNHARSLTTHSHRFLYRFRPSDGRRGLTQRDIVVATLCKPPVLDDLVAQYPRTQFLVLPLDVTNEAQVKSVLQTNDTFGRIDVVSDR